MLPLCNAVSTIDCACDLSALIHKRTDIDDCGYPRAIWPLDDHFLVIDLRNFSGAYEGDCPTKSLRVGN
jgi:hypothetical protein